MAESTEKIDDMWKENMNEWVFEETKIVTYKWLSKQISVHVNIAKQMLFEFVQSSQSKKSSLEVVYLLAGRIALPPHSIKVCLVKSKDLPSKEAEFQSITSKHIYAVSKAQPGLLKETNLCQVDLSIRNKEDNTDSNFSKYSSIGNKKAVPNRLPNFDKGYLEPKKEIKNEPKTESKNEPAANLQKKEPANKGFDAKKSTAIKGMFDKQTTNSSAKITENKNSNSAVAKQKSDDKKTQAKGNGIAGMFAKAAAKQTTSSTVKKEKKDTPEEKTHDFGSENSPGKENRINVKIEEKNDDSKSSNVHNDSHETYDKKESIKDKKQEQVSQPKSHNKKKRQISSKTNDTQAKRRKRIQVMSDSDSDAENEVEDQNASPPSPPPPQAKLIESDEELLPPTPIVTEKKSKPGRHRVKKQVSKTFVDEEGFMVTKKVMESCSETDEEPDKVDNTAIKKTSSNESQKKVESKNEARNVKPKAMGAQNNKQSSIMSFFQKK